MHWINPCALGGDVSWTAEKVTRCTREPSRRFVGFAYAHARWLPTTQRFRKSLERFFDDVEVMPTVWRNLPPAYIYRCYKAPR